MYVINKTETKPDTIVAIKINNKYFCARCKNFYLAKTDPTYALIPAGLLQPDQRCAWCNYKILSNWQE